MNRWTLPGPQRYISSIERALRDGCNVICATPALGLSGLGEALRCQLSDDGWMVAGPYTDESGNPLDILYAAMDVPDKDSSRRSILSLLSSLEPGTLVIIEAIHRDRWAEWKIFLAEYEAASRGLPRLERPLILAITSGAPMADLGHDGVALKIFPWQNVVGELDVILFVMTSLLTRALRPSRVRLLARIIARLSLWDLDLATQLARCDEAMLFEPIQALQWTSETADPILGLEANWYSGGRLFFDDVQQDHSYLLLTDSGKHEKLRLRLWEAQASEFFPLIETKRHELAKQMRPFIRTPIRLGEQSFSDIDELEIGQLAYLAKSQNLKVSIRNSTDMLRRYRNKLAHMEPLSHSETIDVVQNVP